ncbi:hypothetical protein M406DRAFT_321243 [Cryphonectria parasitica EP155]|uniref:Uncharacterized protein n=1 Tax=Cryphonectria parasitica (strain ATCC 38755 / EP155) TaxID=660469 RepID=A0A9P5CTC8_CRYP1|nr:uncharacterized protein M406DRAFT_321243 [Cryphonectria parasitica EP155]KAF3769281.1 hypothetical protein M406DRAFT_321243 [Cryphonectria parasitica EP155]
MESLQLAQMLADISDLSAADQKAAKGLLNANKTLPTHPQQPQQAHLQPPAPTQTPTPGSGAHRPPASASGNRFDKFGRKILTPPPMSRSNSTGPPSQVPSMPGTPREGDDDVHQASTLMTLYEIRNRLKQQDSTGLKKAREQIDALIAKNKQQEQQQQHQQQQQQGGGQADKQKTERPRPISRTYTYPRGEPTSSTSETK